MYKNATFSIQRAVPMSTQNRRLHCKLTFFLSFYYRFVADIISTVEFDHTGDYLATGDKGGRVVLFERNEGVSCGASTRQEVIQYTATTRTWLRLY